MKSNLRIIAEIGSVHDGSFGNALRLIDVAAQAGADIVKFQTHIAEAETLMKAPNPSYFKDESRFDYFKRTAFSFNQWQRLKQHALDHNIGFLSSPFSLEAVDLLEDLGVDFYKIPSGEVTNLPLLEKIAATKKEVFLSSGMSNWKELDAAVAIFDPSKLTVMQCSSEYPCKPEHVGINVIEEMKERYCTSIGFSDHTVGYAAAILAVGRGACLIEKHITYSKFMYGSDARHSMEPSEFKKFCEMLREAQAIYSHPVDKDDVRAYSDMKEVFEKSIVTSIPVQGGTKISMNNIAFKKPGNGISAGKYKSLLGRVFRHNLPQDHILQETDITDA